jgi:hypothetical protein
VDDLELIGLQDNPGEVVTTIQEFVCSNPSEFAALTYAGTNPLEVLGWGFPTYHPYIPARPGTARAECVKSA